MDDFEHIRMTYKSLKQITGDFSTVIGRGPFGVVYEGQGSGTQELAVKVLDSSAGVGGQEDLDRFVRVLAKVKHPNIIQLLGYCYETSFKHPNIIQFMALCFEYMHNRSLHNYLWDDADHGLGWHIRYKIIKGICEGLKYLHMNSEAPIFHLNLKPANILLDKKTGPENCRFWFTCSPQF